MTAKRRIVALESRIPAGPALFPWQIAQCDEIARRCVARGITIGGPDGTYTDAAKAVFNEVFEEEFG